MTLDELREDRELVNSINWDMTPEEAISLHLEWGPLRDQSYYNSRDSENETVYFIISTWEEVPTLYLVKRKGFSSDYVLIMELPERFVKDFIDEVGNFNGVYAINSDIHMWLENELLAN